MVIVEEARRRRSLPDMALPKWREKFTSKMRDDRKDTRRDIERNWEWEVWQPTVQAGAQMRVNSREEKQETTYTAQQRRWRAKQSAAERKGRPGRGEYDARQYASRAILYDEAAEAKQMHVGNGNVAQQQETKGTTNNKQRNSNTKQGKNKNNNNTKVNN